MQRRCRPGAESPYALRRVLCGAVVLLAITLVASPGSFGTPGTDPPSRPIPPNLLEPIPGRGGVAAIPGLDPNLRPAALRRTPAYRRGLDDAEALRRRFLASRRAAEIRAEGVAGFAAFTTAPQLLALADALRQEQDDARLALLDHLARHGSAGQAALAELAIRGGDAGIRGEALRRLTRPPDAGALAVLDEALRESRHAIVDEAGVVAAHLEAVEAIPLLIFAQLAVDRVPRGGGGGGTIAIGTLTSYVANVVPVVSGRIRTVQPIPGLITTGVSMQVRDSVVFTYRSGVHSALVGLVALHHGEDLSRLGYDPRAWWVWFNEVLVPANQTRASQALVKDG